MVHIGVMKSDKGGDFFFFSILGVPKLVLPL